MRSMVVRHRAEARRSPAGLYLSQDTHLLVSNSASIASKDSEGPGHDAPALLETRADVALRANDRASDSYKASKVTGHCASMSETKLL